MTQKEEAELWCLKGRRKNQVSVVLRRSHDIQHFQDREFIVYGCDELLQTRSRHPKGDAAHAITVLECKQYSLFIFWGEVVIFVVVINNEGKGRGMCQHIFYRRSTCTNEAKTEVGGGPIYEVSPSSADLCGLVPPPFVAPIPVNTAAFVFFEGTRSTEMEYIEKRIVVEDVDKWTG